MNSWKRHVFIQFENIIHEVIVCVISNLLSRIKTGNDCHQEILPYKKYL